VRASICLGQRGLRGLGGCRAGRVKDKAGGGGRGGTIFLRIGLGMGIAVGLSPFAID
jgi:hypothetical protein